ncbi:hypothetical protein MASR1M32_37410 [Rhodobacter sp.]
MRGLFTLAVCGALLAGCGSGGNGAVVERSPDGKAAIETQIGPDGSKVIEVTMGSGAANSLPAGLLPPEAAAEYARIASALKPGEVGYYRYVSPGATTAAPVTQSLPDLAGVPQSVTTKTDGKTVTQTYAYGTPPANSAPKPAAARPVADTSYSGVPACSLTFSGGSGYACAYSN